MKAELCFSEKTYPNQLELPGSDQLLFLTNGGFEILFQSRHDGTITFFNKLFLSTFGEVDSLINIFQFPDEYTQLLQDLTCGQHRQSSEVRLKHASGSIVIGKLNVRCDYDTVGQEIITWVVLDFTEQHESQQKFQQQLQQKEDDLNKLKAEMEQFLYKTSHDLRAPLTTVLGLIHLMRFELPSDEILDYAGKIECSINRLDNVIKDIIRFSQNSYTRLHSEKVFFEPMVSRIIESFNNLPNYKQIKFDLEIEENGIFFCDNQRLEIILTNLIRNAIMFADVNKTMPFVTIKGTLREDAATIAIIDNGIGVGQRHLSHIFKMFYRATDRVQGAGLGLYVANEAAIRLHGKIEFQSEVGFGSIFLVTIPNDLKGQLVAKKMRLEKK